MYNCMCLCVFNVDMLPRRSDSARLHLEQASLLHPAAVRCDMVLHQAFRARHVRTKTALAVRCDMVLHRAFRARHAKSFRTSLDDLQGLDQSFQLNVSDDQVTVSKQ